MAGKKIIYPEHPELEQGDYEAQTEAQIAEARRRAELLEKQAKWDRDAALIGDMAGMFAKGAAMHGGAWKVNKDESQAAKGNEKLRALQSENAARLAEYAKMRVAAQDAQRKERNAQRLAQYNADVEAYKSAVEAEKYAKEQERKDRLEARQAAESTAKIERDKAYANYYNSGKKGSSSNTSITLTFPDGTQHTFSKDKDGENWIDVAYEEAVKAGMSRRMNVKRDNLGNTSEYEDTTQRGRLAALTTWNQANREWTGWKDNNIEVDEDFE